MAISYSLALATPSTTAQVAHALHDLAQAAALFDASVTPQLLLTDGAVTAAGTWIRVIEARPQPWNPVITDLGLTPTVSLAFRLDKTGDIPTQQDHMIQLVSGLLEEVPGDAVLHFEYETIWLLRRADDLSVNERDDLWPPQRLALITEPYRRATHHFSEE